MKLKYSKTSTLFIVFLFFFSKIYSQSYDPSKVISPAPTTAALAAYGNFPVGYHSGKPSISIPLYTINSHDNRLDLSLSYDAGGVRVAQDASWVGLGWSLISGGVISKTVRGYDDFKDAGGYYYSPVLSTNVDLPTYFDIDNGRRDIEPDLYSYNFAGYSGKFVIGKQADGTKIFLDEQNNLKLEYNGNWVVTDPKGYKYYFAAAESSSSYSYSSEAAQVGITTTLAPFAFQQNVVTTGWYLTSIVSPHNDIINLNYKYRESLSVINLSEMQYDRNNELAACLFKPPFSQAQQDFLQYYRSYNASRQKNREAYLESIVFVDGSIEFQTTDRKDVDYVDANLKPAKLTKIIIYNKDHIALKSFTFSHNYFKDNPTNNSTSTSTLRLKLDSVTESGDGSVGLPPYKFVYYSDNNLPGKYSYGIDHWGFANGQLNSRLLPMPSWLSPPGYYGTNDANRESSNDISYTGAATLNSIIYPTGGRTDFEYEINDYGHLQNTNSTIDQGVSYTVSAAPWNTNGNSFVAFDILPDEVDPISHVVVGSIYSTYSYVSGTTIMAGVSTNYGNFSGGASFNNDISKDPNGTGQGIRTPTIPLRLAAGHYTLSVRYIQGYSVSANLNFIKKAKVTQKTGGGLRIKTITDINNTGLSQAKSYRYNNADGSSSGRLLYEQAYGYKCPPLNYYNMPVCDPSSMYICRMSGNVYPPGLSTKGGIIGYDEVTELIGANGEGGKSDYYFLNKESYLLGPSSPGTPALEYEMNGKLSKIVTYNSTGQKLKQIENTYGLKASVSIPGAVVYKGPPIPTTLTYPAIGDSPGFSISNGFPFTIFNYQNVSKWVTLNSSREINYSYVGTRNDSLTVKHDFYYDNAQHLHQTRDVSTKSDGSVETSMSAYADDYASGTGFIDDMKTAHITGLPVESVIFLNRGGTPIVVSGQIVQFKSGGKNLAERILKLRTSTPKSLPAFKFSNAPQGQLPVVGNRSTFSPDPFYQLEATINEYDVAGNPLMILPMTSSPISYIWGYNNHYPVAETRNARSNEVMSNSFEELGSWDGGLTAYDQGFSHNGKTSGRMDASGAGEVVSMSNTWLNISLTAPKRFHYAGWIYSNGPSSQLYLFMKRPGETGYFSYIDYADINVTGRWVYLEKDFLVPSDVTQLNIRVDNNGTLNGGNKVWFDDIRLYPSDAQMKTYTYDPLIGMTSMADVSGRTTSYEYDGLQRLKTVRDNEGNMIKRICYNYAGQQAGCPLTTSTVVTPPGGSTLNLPITYDNETSNGEVTFLKVKNTAGVVLYTFNTAALQAGASIPPGTYTFEYTIKGSWVTLTMNLSDPQYFSADYNGATTYSFSNVNVSNSTFIAIGLYNYYARAAGGDVTMETGNGN